MRRLRRRRSESKESLARRLVRAVDELQEAHDYDYVVVNKKLNKAVSDVSRIIDAEQLRTFRDPDLNDNLERMSTYLAQQVLSLRTEHQSKALT
jgi:guanylate kinase